jgi:hypothetical protein
VKAKRTKVSRWERAAARENARREAKAPLLAHAGLVEQTTAETVRRRAEAVTRADAERYAAHAERASRKIDQMRADLEAIDPARLAALDANRHIYPRGHEYDLDILAEALALTTGKTRAEVFEHYEPRRRVPGGRRVAVPAGVDDVGAANDVLAEEAPPTSQEGALPPADARRAAIRDLK